MTIQELNNELGNIDIYLLDQILKGRYLQSKSILDAGCGEGRNIVWFLKNNFEVFGIDKDASAIRMARFIARSVNSLTPGENFIEAHLEEIPFPNQHFDAVICSAVLHFAKNEKHFSDMFQELMRVLKPGGSLFVRTASNIGAETTIISSKTSQTALPDGSMRFLLTQQLLEFLLGNFGVKMLEPVKTVNVQGIRFMTNLVLEKK